MSTRRLVHCAALVAALLPAVAHGQWSNRYPKVAGFSHHVYLEGYELPLLTNGPMDPAPSPDGRRVAFASRGWLWLLDPATGVARRITRSGGMDSRPRWSPDGRSIAFVRDDGRLLSIRALEVASGVESALVTDSAIVLDPAWAPDGKSLFYSSGIAGDIDVWRLDLATRERTRITDAQGSLELQPLPTPDGLAIVYLAKTRAGADLVRRRTLATGEDRVLAAGNILSMTRGALSPDGRTLALSWPTQEGYELRLTSALQQGATVALFRDERTVPLAPAYSADGATIWFARADAAQRLALMRQPAAGGAASIVPVTSWDWGTRTARLRIVTRIGSGPPVPARLAVAMRDGHPILADSGHVRFDGQNGIPFFYSDGATELTLPAGDVVVTAVQGLATPPASALVTLDPGEVRTITVSMTPVWDARANGWLSGEHHFHLNYGGPYHLAPDLLVQMGRAERLDVLTPMLANLAQRFEDQPLFDYRHTRGTPWIVWAQEVRAHFFGHIGLLNGSRLFWPWIWGLGYDVNQRDDRPNGAALDFARQHGGLTTYVHPVSAPGPFATPASMRGIPLGFIADAVHGKVDAIELACLWSDERGTAELWYRVLNVGIPMALSAGTDAMNNLYRTMAIGTTRVYVHPERPASLASYFAGLKAGRSFVTTGPLLDFHVGRAGPGQVVSRGAGAQAWQLDVHSAVPVDTVEIVVNGTVVERRTGFTTPGTRRYTGTTPLPAGGWIAARVSGPPTQAWPAMDSYAYAHTSPVWIDRVGSTDPATKAAAARDLLQALTVAEQALEIGYADADHPRLRAHYAAARGIIGAWVTSDH
ncbi:MAG: CehA/McbA family metallohydrolase [Gemmatimonadaceae bacterium]|nr:CehA/McbA family metallohydrolase [Gemmatimonadaceae bacterium]